MKARLRNLNSLPHGDDLRNQLHNCILQDAVQLMQNRGNHNQK